MKGGKKEKNRLIIKVEIKNKREQVDQKGMKSAGGGNKGGRKDGEQELKQTFCIHVDGETFLKATMWAPIPSCLVHYAFSLPSCEDEVKVTENIVCENEPKHVRNFSILLFEL